MNKKAGIVWIDSQGERVLSVITTTTGVGAIETALQNHSQAGVVECWEGNDEVYSVTPGTGVYISVRNVAILTFQDASGYEAKLLLYAPNSNIFLADGLTVDPTTITDIITAATTYLVTATGSVVTTFKGGQLIQSRLSGIATL